MPISLYHPLEIKLVCSFIGDDTTYYICKVWVFILYRIIELLICFYCIPFSRDKEFPKIFRIKGLNFLSLWNNFIASADDSRPYMSKLIPTLAFCNVEFNG